MGPTGQKRGLGYVCLAPFWALCQRNPRQTALRPQAESVIQEDAPRSAGRPGTITCLGKVAVLSSSKAANSISSDRRGCPVLAAPGTRAASAAGSRNAPSGRVAESQPLGRALKPQGEESEVAQSCLILGNLMDCSPPGSSVHENFQARILEWFVIFFSRGFS